ncbi:MAG: hypothetical protein ABIR30_13050 [Chitinophagaceae bacterium]
MNWFGQIVIGDIENIQHPGPDGEQALLFIPLEETNIRFVHYPDCQQLIIWLTHPGREYGNIRLFDSETGDLKEEWPVNDKLNGSIQILWDTLTVKPGSYTLEIDWKNGSQHRIGITKYKEGVLPETKQTINPLKSIKAEEIAQPIVYKDGTGKIIPDEDIQLREKLKKEIAAKFSRRLVYEGNFRAGTIIYIDGNTRIEFSHEMGGGNCMLYIDIPSEKQWEQQTQTTIGKRNEILKFIAQTVQAEQASHCHYEIKETSIGFYYN